jgi:tRNA ligase
MAFVVRLLNEPNAGGVQFSTVNKVAHVTIGTASANIKPKESNDLLQKWLAEGSGPETGIREEKVQGNMVLEGSVKGVLQKY